MNLNCSVKEKYSITSFTPQEIIFGMKLVFDRHFFNLKWESKGKWEKIGLHEEKIKDVVTRAKKGWVEGTRKAL